MGAEQGIPVAVVRPNDLGQLGSLIAAESGIARTASGWRGLLGRLLSALSGPSGRQTTTSSDSDEAGAAGSDAVREAVARWRERVQRDLDGALAQPLDWDESDDAPYFTDKPAWDGYGSLVLLAAHAEHPELPRPTQVTHRFDADPAWKASTANPDATRYRHLLTPELWLPCDFDLVFEADDLGENTVAIGSSVKLLAELRDLNARTFRGSAADLERWLQDGAEPQGPFDDSARFGLALFLDLAEKSVTHRLPMKLDY
jgi:hypothetical protein